MRVGKGGRGGGGMEEGRGGRGEGFLSEPGFVGWLRK